MSTKASDRPVSIRIRRRTWRHLLAELSARGGGHREAGAFLLGRRHGRRPVVTLVVFFDDLEPGSLDGAVHLTTKAYSNLYEICRDARVEVLADVHTHPGSMVRQSPIDQENPLIAQRGHIALIIGDYAQRLTTLGDIGVYEYRGDDGWTTRPAAVRHRRWL